MRSSCQGDIRRLTFNHAGIHKCQQNLIFASESLQQTLKNWLTVYFYDILDKSTLYLLVRPRTPTCVTIGVATGGIFRLEVESS